ncbi:Heat shock protein GrpE [Indibacter alkaliphilus LW1]|jgi:molecular chaperone GrpE|uniref:Protein GrpE n=1 Tax=Indibacter alkaliphilus (strain CCUG 57479 / KCTC 22604 / LW1) TaxID=1189612 RepID=S2EBH5_INDAL|nr:nucleotide exchange factor GrpE [Indibacter alkaliphilus]EOZ99723.1 Heat shock protein GrpE [Indibacter alkaliphilus LW1]
MQEKEIINEEQETSNEVNQDQNTDPKENTENNQEPSSSESPELSQEEKLQFEVQELKDKYLRLYSEFDNYRRRTAKEKLDLIKTASEDLIKDILPIVDDFERAFKASEGLDDAVKVREGNQLVFQKLVKTLETKGVKVMDDLIGKPFDAETQEAITQIPAPNDEMKGKVIDVVEKGYTLGDKVVRYAKVVTGA